MNAKSMIDTIEIRKRAEKDLKALPKTDGRRVAEAILNLKPNLDGDVKRLTNHTPEFRLRVGTWRVLFEIEGSKVVIYRILNRKDAYR